MNRFWVVLIFGGLIFWQSSCLEFRDGMIINRCGLWQKVTGGAVVLAMKIPERIVLVPIDKNITDGDGRHPGANANLKYDAGCKYLDDCPPGTTAQSPPVTISTVSSNTVYQMPPSRLPPVIMATPNSIQFYGNVTGLSIPPSDYIYESYRNGRYR